MNEATDYSLLFLDSLQAMGRTFMMALPRIFAAIVVLLLGWLIARLISRVVERVLTVAKFDVLAQRVGADDMIARANVKETPSNLIARFIYWVLILVVIITAADTVGWTAVSTEISKLLSYLPQLLAAIVFFIIGFYIVTFIRNAIRGATGSLGISAGRIISSVIYYLLLLIVSLTALEQAGVDTSIITSNMLVIVGAIMLAAAISYGFASREVMANILAGFFNRRVVKIGQTIEVDGQRGEVVAITSLSVTLQINAREKLVIPSQRLISQSVLIVEGGEGVKGMKG
ncbi:small-conductance mechanosensitive channel [Lewinella aquimaris]|uniref:Small-conductance mechanosensitive channel n=1 Tax=Neolewinella aquimaris TaxID=1835722 RepID=A0A840E2G9_9BACT|nr:mechanosensitive ion channel domain-containing protein [Neolewinella aquimaris]MBB4079774.1 small-conductance mechanosensitive channel [Neolewinella aquimaris]